LKKLAKYLEKLVKYLKKLVKYLEGANLLEIYLAYSRRLGD